MKYALASMSALAAASAQGLFADLLHSQEHQLVRRDDPVRFDSCGLPLKATWKANGRFSKQHRLNVGGRKRTCEERRAAHQVALASLSASAGSYAVAAPQTDSTAVVQSAESDQGSTGEDAIVYDGPAEDAIVSDAPADDAQAPSDNAVSSASASESSAEPSSAAAPRKAKVAHVEDPATSSIDGSSTVDGAYFTPQSSPSYAPTSSTPAVEASAEATTTAAAVVVKAKVALGGSNVKKRGLAWAVNDNWAPTIATDQIGWLWHWQDGPVATASHIPYVPQLWSDNGNSIAQFNAVMAGLGDNLPEYILGFNEPDIATQSNMSPAQAAAAWKQHLEPYAAKGVKLCTPAPAWDLTWMQGFMAACSDCTISCISMHSYDDYDPAFGKFKARVEAMHAAFPSLPIWVTEWALIGASNPSPAQAQQYLQDSARWLESQPYVDRYSWFGAWADNPDGYSATNDKFFNGDGSLTSLGSWYAYGS